MRSWTTLTISWSTLLRSEQGDEVQEWMHKRLLYKCIPLDLKINTMTWIRSFKCRKWSSRAPIRTGIFDLSGLIHLGSHLPWSELVRGRFRHPCFRAYSFGTLKRPVHNRTMSTEPTSVCYLLVSPPLHLRLVVADIISLLAFGQVRNTAELLVVVHELVLSPNAVHSLCGWRERERRHTG